MLRAGHDLLFVSNAWGQRLTYWSPRDPYRLRSINFLDWRIQEFHGDLFVFGQPASDVRLYWLWGSATAVRSRFAAAGYGRTNIRECNGAVIITARYPHYRVYCVWALDLKCERTQDYLPPPTLPADSAPLVTPRLLLPVRGGPAVCQVLGARGSEEPPYVTLRHKRSLFEVT